MKKLTTLFTLALLLITTNSALALTPYERAVALMNTISVTPTTTYQLANGTTVCLDLTTDLSREDKGTKPEQVTKLQNFLYPKYLQEPATGYFGVLTEAAVKKFQAEYANEIATPTGYVGPLTRNIIKTLTCTGTQASTLGTKANETTTPRNTSTATAYDPNGAWWLAPAPTPTTGPTGTGSTDPIKTTNTGNNTTPASTTTPPANCDQYAGVIPGESRKVSVEYRRWAHQKYNYPISTEAQAQLNTMRGDLGNLQSFRMFGGGFGGWSRERFNSGVVYVWPIKTTEYNDKVVISMSGAENTQTVDGEVVMSISKCPGDFTSPQLLSQKINDGERLSACVSQEPVFGNFGLIVTSGNPNGYTCDLEPNSQYYLNISAGFSKSSPLDSNGMPTQSPGLGIGGRSNGTSWIFPGVQSADMIMYAQDYRGQGYNARPANGAPGLIKGKDEYYRENDRVYGIVMAALRQRVAACRAAIVAGGQQNRGILGGGGECTGLGNPLPPYEWD